MTKGEGITGAFAFLSYKNIGCDIFRCMSKNIYSLMTFSKILIILRKFYL